MIRRPLVVFMLCLMLGGLAVHAFAEDTVKLEYKFKAGDVLRYKMVADMTVSIGATGPESPAAPGMPAKVVSVMKQQTTKVLPDGDAEVVMTVESMKLDMNGNTQDVALDKVPPVTMVMSKNGSVKSVTGLQNTSGVDPSQFMNFGNLGQYAGLPTGELKVGDTWTQDVPFPMGNGSLHVVGKLTSTSTKVGSYDTAAFNQDINGTIGFAMQMPIPGAGSGSPMSTTAIVKGTSTTYFSTSEGFIVRAEGKGNAYMTMNLGTDTSGKPATMNVGLVMAFQMFRLPPK